MKLSEVCDRITDGSHNPPKGVLFSEYLMLSSKNIFDDRITLTEPRYLTESEFISENARTEISQNDLLMTIVGTVGRVAIVPPNFPPVCLQRSVAVLKLDKVRVNPRYMMYQLQSMRPSFEDEAHGVAQKGLYLKQLANTTIICPPLETQKQIAATLDSVTRVIDLCNAFLEKLALLVKARFVEMFGDVKLNSKHLNTIQLDQIADVGSSKRVFVEELQERGIPFYRGTEVGALAEGKSIVPELFITEEHYNLLSAATGIPVIGDLLMPSICSDGRIWLVDTEEKFYFKDGRVLWIHPVSDTINSVYLLHFLKQKIAIDYSSIASGTTFAELKIFALKGLTVLVPPLALQEQFAAFVAQTDQTKSAVKKVLEKAETLKKALMQEYFGP